MSHFAEGLKIWLQFGTGNHRRFISVNKLYEILGASICGGLPAFHAFTGCDFNPSFYRIGKKRPWVIYAGSLAVQKAFKDIQDPSCNDYRYLILYNFIFKLQKLVAKLYAIFFVMTIIYAKLRQKTF